MKFTQKEMMNFFYFALNIFGPCFFLFLIAWCTAVPLFVVVPPLCYSSRFPLLSLWCFRFFVCFLGGEVLLHFLCASCISLRLGTGPRENEGVEENQKKEEEQMTREERKNIIVEGYPLKETKIPSSLPSSLAYRDSSVDYSSYPQQRCCNKGFHPSFRSFFSSFSCHFLCVPFFFLSEICHRCLSPLMRLRRNRRVEKKEEEKEEWRENVNLAHLHRVQHLKRGLWQWSFLSLFHCLFKRKWRSSSTSPACPTTPLAVLQAIEQYIFTSENILTPTQRRRWLLDAPRRYCKMCQRYKAPREHHCRICGECVPNMDHHCVWIGQCVDVLNERFFFSLLCWVWISVSVECVLLGYGYAAYSRMSKKMMMSAIELPSVSMKASSSRLSSYSSSSWEVHTPFGPNGSDLQSSYVVEVLVAAGTIWICISFFLLFFSKNIFTNTTSIEEKVLSQKQQLFSSVSSFHFKNPYRILWPLTFDTSLSPLPVPFIMHSQESNSVSCESRGGQDVFPPLRGGGVSSGTQSSTMRMAYCIGSCPPQQDGHRPSSESFDKAKTRIQENVSEAKDGNPLFATSLLEGMTRVDPMKDINEGDEKRKPTGHSSLRLRLFSSMLNVLEAYGILQPIVYGWSREMKEKQSGLSTASFSCVETSMQNGCREKGPCNGENFFHYSSSSSFSSSFAVAHRVAIFMGIKVLKILSHEPRVGKVEERERERGGSFIVFLKESASFASFRIQAVFWVSALWLWLLIVPMISGRDELVDGLDYPLA